jgi:hypothetical protein
VEAPQGQQAAPPAADQSQPAKTARPSIAARHAAVNKARAADGKFLPREASTEAPKDTTDSATASHAADSEATPATTAESAAAKTPAESRDADKLYAIAERKKKAAIQRERAAEEREKRLSVAETRLQSVYGDPDAAKQAYDKGEFHAAARYVQRIFGDDFATITQKIARATAGLAPERLKELEERDKFAAEKRAFEAEKKRVETERQQAVTRQQALGTVKAKCAGHEALKLRNGPDLVLREMEASWDERSQGFRLTLAQAADKVVADRLADAEALGAKRAQARLVETPATKPATKQAPVPTAGKKLSFEERHAIAGRRIAQRRAGQ